MAPLKLQPRTARMTPLGLQPCRRYATEVRGSTYNHDTGVWGEERVLICCYGTTQDASDEAARKFGRVWETATGT